MFNSENDEDPVLKLMNWIGSSAFEKNDENDDYYPFATSHNVDSKGDSAGDFSLFLKGTGSIGKDYHEPWFNFLKNTETYNFKSGANFGVRTLLKLLELIKPQKGVATENQKRWMFIENIKYLPKQVTAEITMQGLESVEIKAIKQAH
jgi:hypothetical protein